MEQATKQSQIGFFFYRLGTVLKSLKALYTLPQDKVDAFVNSYAIYDYDWDNEEELIKAMGKDYYKEVKRKLIDCYSVWNHLCAIGQVEKMYIPPAMDLGVSIIKNQVLFEQKMAKDLGLKKGMKALDIGCGRGRVANHVATFSGAHVTGMNIDQNQLESARRFAAGTGMNDRLQFVEADLNDPLPFPDASFDSVYHIQVFSLSKNPLKLFKEIHRILKPGGKFAGLDWFILDKYDHNNPEHAALMKRVKPLIGAIGTRRIPDFINVMKKAGFDIQINENASLDGLQSPLIDNADKFYTTATRLIHTLVKVKLLPKHFKALFDRLTKDGQAFVEADRMRLVTTSHYIVAQKKG